jgi:RecJ-like exonuclease
MTDKEWLRKTADEGYELCPSCRGRGWCKWCRGTGRLLTNPADRCDACAGESECMVCDGAGQLMHGHYALEASKD